VDADKPNLQTINKIDRQQTINRFQPTYDIPTTIIVRGRLPGNVDISTMEYLYNIGRIFFGIATAGLGLQTMYDKDFPYMLIPPHDSWIHGLALCACISGALLAVAGVCIVLQKQIRPVSLVLGSLLLLIFCFYHLPYECMSRANYMHFGNWENAAKELALSAGAFVVAGKRFPGKAASFGTIVFSLTMISFGMDHYLYANEAVGYMPSWVSHPIGWLYITGSALIGSGTAIILKIKPGWAATLLGIMIFIWVIILHIPKVIMAAPADLVGELASAFLALAYCGTAFSIAGAADHRPQ
jgi:hypothetical protein